MIAPDRAQYELSRTLRRGEGALPGTQLAGLLRCCLPCCLPCCLLCCLLCCALLVGASAQSTIATAGLTPREPAPGHTARSVVNGDCDGNGAMGISDALVAVQHVLAVEEDDCLTGRALAACDVNGDRRISMVDVMRLAQAVTGSRTGELESSLAGLRVPTGVVGIPYRFEIPESAWPPDHRIVNFPQLPPQVHLDLEDRILEASFESPALVPFELDLEGPAGRYRLLAIDLEFTLPPPPERVVLPGTGPEALVATTLATNLVPEAITSPDQDIRALCATPRRWREEPQGVLLLVAVRDQLKALLTGGEGSTGHLATLFRPHVAEQPGPRPPVTGMAFVGDACYLIDAGGALGLQERDHATGSHRITHVCYSPDLEGATSLLVQEVEGVPVALVATIDDPQTQRHLVWIPLGVSGEELPGRLVVQHGVSGGTFGAAFITGAGTDPVLLARQQLRHLSRYQISPTGEIEPRQPETGITLPTLGVRDTLLATSDGRSLLYSAGRGGGEPLEPDGGMTIEEPGVWLVTFGEGTWPELLLYGCEPGRPAGAMTLGPSSLGTGTSLFVAGNGEVYEIFGRRHASFSF